LFIKKQLLIYARNFLQTEIIKSYLCPVVRTDDLDGQTIFAAENMGAEFGLLSLGNATSRFHPREGLV